jgi:hypothetical protein
MVLRGLTDVGADDLAYDIARNHVENVSGVFQETGTLWENYAPERVKQGFPSKPDFVGWTGVSAISIPIEYLIGLRIDPMKQELHWDLRLEGRHGVLRYPLTRGHYADLLCVSQTADTLQLSIHTTQAFTLVLHHRGRVENLMIQVGDHDLRIT